MPSSWTISENDPDRARWMRMVFEMHTGIALIPSIIFFEKLN